MADSIADVDARLDLERQAYLAAEQAGDLDDATRHWHAMDALLDVRCGMRREATT
jgi:hypothetical protein